LSRQESLDLSNSLATATEALAQTKSTLLTAQSLITNLNVHISDLEAQNKVLDQRADELTNTIAQLNSLIETTQAKLAQADTNNAFLQAELQKQMAQKADLEHKFNDLNEVRAQVSKLKDEMFIARRMQLMKNDNSGKKGAELLMKRTPPPDTNVPPKSPSNYDLNVEVGSDGSIKVIPPIGATNAPAR
jgi:chromosome segregation ATPase